MFKNRIVSAFAVAALLGSAAACAGEEEVGVEEGVVGEEGVEPVVIDPATAPPVTQPVAPATAPAAGAFDPALDLNANGALDADEGMGDADADGILDRDEVYTPGM